MGSTFTFQTFFDPSADFFLEEVSQNATTSPQAQVTPGVRKRPGGPGRENYWVRLLYFVIFHPNYLT
ncbi:hypothetical protein PAPYR_224 [Paratrimastix pyriformis]|uniref:Uncharacterized protein n=1 Tax=Paratrimastix pyriformis TaxID=342808 RepID=A0ABQ8V1P1_9EUKA|nr:hypothetical protein PAPYR_224 [Paratrimastix pyriformis]